jgi:ADP-ribose pyrophosphatase
VFLSELTAYNYIGMTTANMKIVTLDVTLKDELETPEQKLDEGEAIVKRVVALKDLYNELKGK